MVLEDELILAFDKVLNKQKKPTAGIDKMTADKYADVEKRYSKRKLKIIKKKGEKLLETMEKALLENKYNFTPYSEILVLKGANKPPRKISKPTIKDKILLKLLNERLREINEYKRLSKKAYTVVHSIKKFLKKNKNINYLKLDISKYYDSIDIDRLISKLYLDSHLSPQTIQLVEDAIRNPTVPANYRKVDKEKYISNNGVPQGLSISNILSEIYLMDFDKAINKYLDTIREREESIILEYFRYVDDIVLFSSNAYILEELKIYLKNGLDGLGLSLNDEKEQLHHFSKQGINYLGYHFSDDDISILEKNNKKLMDRMIAIIKETNKKLHLLSDAKDIQSAYFHLLWRLNIIISGAYIDERLYGWMAYFRQVTSIRQLQKVDHVLKKKLLKTYLDDNHFKAFSKCLDADCRTLFSKLSFGKECDKISNIFTLKSLVKVFDEIRHRKNPKNYKYVINPEEINDDCKKILLFHISTYSEERLNHMKKYEIRYHFNRLIFTEIKKLLDTIGVSGSSG